MQPSWTGSTQHAMSENSICFLDPSYKEQPGSNQGSWTQRGKEYQLQHCSVPRSSYYIWTASQRPPVYPPTTNAQFVASKYLNPPLCSLFCKVILNERIAKALAWKRINLPIFTWTILLSVAKKLHESQLLLDHKRASIKEEELGYTQIPRAWTKMSLVLSALQLVLAAPLTLARAQ